MSGQLSTPARGLVWQNVVHTLHPVGPPLPSSHAAVEEGVPAKGKLLLLDRISGVVKPGEMLNGDPLAPVERRSWLLTHTQADSYVFAPQVRCWL
jgi:hypothetical protein